MENAGRAFNACYALHHGDDSANCGRPDDWEFQRNALTTCHASLLEHDNKKIYGPHSTEDEEKRVQQWGKLRNYPCLPTKCHKRQSGIFDIGIKTKQTTCSWRLLKVKLPFSPLLWALGSNPTVHNLYDRAIMVIYSVTMWEKGENFSFSVLQKGIDSLGYWATNSMCCKSLLDFILYIFNQSLGSDSRRSRALINT